LHGPDSIDRSEKWPAIDYELSFSVMGRLNATGLPRFQERVQSVFAESGAFTRYQPGIGGSSHHLKLSLDNHGNLGLAAASGFISGLTLLIIPGYARDEYTLVAEVSHGSEVLNRYEYHDSMATWTQILLIFAMPFKFPSTVADQVIDNMIWNLLADLEKDEILKQPEIEAATRQGVDDAEGARGADATTAERLDEAKALRDKGLITEAEYQEMRAEILGGL
jgi:hypothetical protein